MTQYRPILNILISFDSWCYVVEWLRLTPSDLQRLSQRRTARLCARAREMGESLAAKDIVGELAAIAKRRYSPSSRFLVKAIVVAIGGLTFGQGFRLLAESILSTTELGAFVPAVAFIGGLSTSACVDTLATIALTNWNKRRDFRRHIQPIERSWKESQAKATEVTEAYYGGQRGLVQTVEGRSAIWQIPLYTLAAGTLSVLEFTVTLHVVRSPLSRNLLARLLDTTVGEVPNALELAIASLPVMITWASALLQSYYFERPEYARDWLRRHEKYLKPRPDWSDEVRYAWIEDQLYQDGRLNAELDFILGRSTNGDLKNLQMAVAYYDACYIEAQMHRLLEISKGQDQHLREQYELDLANLPEKAELELPPWITQDRSDLEIFEQGKRRRQLRDAWVQEESQKLMNRFQESLKTVEIDCREGVQRLYRKWQAAASRYRAGYCQWKKLNQYD